MGYIVKILSLFMVSACLIFSGCRKKESVEIAADDENLGEIEVMVPPGSFQDFVKDRIVPGFNKIYPDIKVTVSNDDKTILNTRLAAGDAPDIYAGTFGYMPVKYVKMNRLVNYEKFSDYKTFEGKLMPKFIGRLLGGAYYVPWCVTTQLMIYNKDLFREAGLDPDKPPVTFEQFLKYAEKISKLPNRKDGKKVFGTVFWNDALSWGGWYWTMLSPPYYNMNQGKYQLLNKQGTTIAFNRPEAKMKQYLEFMRSAQQYAPMDMRQTFFSRTIGMWLQFGYGWKSNLKEADGNPMKIGDDVEVAPIPVPKAGDTAFSTLDGRALMIFKSNLKREKLAWIFIKYMMNDENCLNLCKEIGQLPTLKSLQNDPFFQRPDTKPFMEQLDDALPNEDAPESDEIQNLVLHMYAQTVVLKENKIDSAIKETAEKAIVIFKKNQM